MEPIQTRILIRQATIERYTIRSPLIPCVVVTAIVFWIAAAVFVAGRMVQTAYRQSYYARYLPAGVSLQSEVRNALPPPPMVVAKSLDRRIREAVGLYPNWPNKQGWLGSRWGPERTETHVAPGITLEDTFIEYGAVGQGGTLYDADGNEIVILIYRKNVGGGSAGGTTPDKTIIVVEVP